MGNALSRPDLVVAYQQNNESEEAGESSVEQVQRTTRGLTKVIHYFMHRKTAPTRSQYKPAVPKAYSGLHQVLCDYEVLNCEGYPQYPLLIKRRTRKLAPRSVKEGVTKIELRSQSIITLTPVIGELFMVQQVDLSDNLLFFLPDAIGKLSFLERLNLSGNNLSQLPDSIGDLRYLRHINLERNHLQALPDSFGQLQRLRRLQIGHNQLQQLPKCITRLPKLTFLCVKHNYALRQLPGRLVEMPRLHFIETMGCDMIGGEAELERYCRERSSLGPPSLLECGIRIMIRGMMDIPECIEELFNNPLQAVEPCDHCNEPIIWHSVSRGRFVEQPTETFCLIYRMCRMHWENEKERVRALFKCEAGNDIQATDWISHLNRDSNKKESATAHSFIIIEGDP